MSKWLWTLTCRLKLTRVVADVEQDPPQRGRMCTIELLNTRTGLSSVEGFVLEQHNSGVITVSNSNFSLAPLCNFKVLGDREDQYFHIAQLNSLFMWGVLNPSSCSQTSSEFGWISGSRLCYTCVITHSFSLSYWRKMLFSNELFTQCHMVLSFQLLPHKSLLPSS